MLLHLNEKYLVQSFDTMYMHVTLILSYVINHSKKCFHFHVNTVFNLPFVILSNGIDENSLRVSTCSLMNLTNIQNDIDMNFVTMTFKLIFEKRSKTLKKCYCPQIYTIGGY